MTAEEYAFENMQGCDLYEIVSALEGFAKLKCEELLVIVAEKAKAEIKYEYSGNTGSEYLDEWAVIDKNSILNAVNLNEFIK